MALTHNLYHAIAVVYGGVTLAYLSVWCLLEANIWRPQTPKRREQLMRGTWMRSTNGPRELQSLIHRSLPSSMVSLGPPIRISTLLFDKCVWDATALPNQRRTISCRRSCPASPWLSRLSPHILSPVHGWKLAANRSQTGSSGSARLRR